MYAIEQFPNPIKRRARTELLNGGFEFSLDAETWEDINVPFCPESKLSGLGITDFIPVCYYRKRFRASGGGERVILHFGAVDYNTTVYINNNYAGNHVGGYTPFEFDITDYLNDGENELYLVVRDSEWLNAATGKQSYKKNSFGCFYTRTTGIWQPVWLEYRPDSHIENFFFYPNVDECSVDIELFVSGKGRYRVEIFFAGERVGFADGEIVYVAKIKVMLSEKHLWRAGEGKLYDVRIDFEGDEVYSYFGLREAAYRDMRFTLNGENVYQRFVLDQGFYPDGIYTAPSVADMQRDIDLSLKLGFNGARLHQKVFDPRFLYLCDKAGYMVWGEYPSWGIDYSTSDGLGQFISEWNEVLNRDFNHPSIITWCPLNEIYSGEWEHIEKGIDINFCQNVYNFTKSKDKTRPCVDVSGGIHGKNTDLFDFHCYEPISKITGYLKKIDEDDTFDFPLLFGKGEKDRKIRNVPINFSECGGFSFCKKGCGSTVKEVNKEAVQSSAEWGYGKGECSSAGFIKRYKDIIELIFSCDKISGFCYTQLYDVEQEINGFYKYDRSDKLTEREKGEIRNINLKK